MYTKVYDKPEIYSVLVPLPNNPLRSLNVYVVKTDAGNLIIDNGFNQPECLEAIQECLTDLNIDLGNTTLFLTHLHADHTGLTCSLIKEGTKIYMNPTDYDYMGKYLTGENWDWTEAKFASEGFDPEEIVTLRGKNQARIWAADYLFEAEMITDGFVFHIGEYEFECIFTPGHTPGHTSLYLRNEKVMFLGDHVLFDITPNITMWRGMENSLASYLKSLEKIKKYDMKVALPAHRNFEMDVYDRIEEIKEHHKERLQETFDIVSAEEGMTATGIGSRLKWSMRGKTWAEFPPQQKWFAIGETLSHLDYLIAEGKVKRVKGEDELNHYFLG